METQKDFDNFNFKKKFGQNFISDTNLLNAIASDAGLCPDDEVLEIGAGAGSLTQILSQRARKVVSYEIDRELQSVLLSLELPNVDFVFADFMGENLQKLREKFTKNIKVVANLPYYITTPIIFKLLEECDFLDSLTIMVQKEVAERITAQAGGKDYGILTVMTSLFGTPKITRIVGKQMFRPMPNVDSAILHIKIEEKFSEIDKKRFSKFIKTCFSMRRKTLQNNLATSYDKNILKMALDEKTLARRAETFSLEEFVEIFKKLQKNC